ncbi:hypothetical protein HGRIS_004486 [Hohenbuehelia grisea]|uniref:Uncharacterized protein n=1 Tax=Hohenbuehelia grisea TaxID=104357 RepID=A0ABR3JCS1_9AGAR
MTLSSTLSTLSIFKVPQVVLLPYASDLPRFSMCTGNLISLKTTNSTAPHGADSNLDSTGFSFRFISHLVVRPLCSLCDFPLPSFSLSFYYESAHISTRVRF